MSTKKDAWLKRAGLKEEPKKKLSVMQALETAVLLMEQAGESEEDIMKYVHLIHLGLIRDGALTEEYVALAHKALSESSEIVVPSDRIQLG
jgi:hypothetical protein